MDFSLLKDESSKTFFQSFISKQTYLLKIFYAALPVSISSITNLMTLLISTHFVGHMDEITSLAAMGLCNVWINFIAFGPLISFDGGFFALASQVNGTNNKKNLKILFQRAAIFNLFMFLISSLFLVLSPYILIGFGAQKNVVEKGLYYLYIHILILFTENFIDLLKNIFNAQKIFDIVSYILVISIIVHYIQCYIFTAMGMGMNGLALSRFLINIYSLMILFIYMKKNDLNLFLIESFESEAKDKLVEYAKIVIPSGFLTYIEWMAFEIITIFASNYDEKVLSTHTLFIYGIGFIYMGFYGVGTTYASYLGNYVGEKNIVKTKEMLSLYNYLMIDLILIYEIIAIFVFKWIMIGLTDKEELIELVMKLKPILILLSLYDFCQGINAHILRSFGLQNYASILYFKTYYLIGVPLAYLFGVYFNYQVYGWFTAMHFSQALFCFFVYFKIKSIDIQVIMSSVEGSLGNQFEL